MAFDGYASCFTLYIEVEFYSLLDIRAGTNAFNKVRRYVNLSRVLSLSRDPLLISEVGIATYIEVNFRTSVP
jgi:hypothetical protein